MLPPNCPSSQRNQPRAPQRVPRYSPAWLPLLYHSPTVTAASFFQIAARSSAPCLSRPARMPPHANTATNPSPAPHAQSARPRRAPLAARSLRSRGGDDRGPVQTLRIGGPPGGPTRSGTSVRISRARRRDRVRLPRSRPQSSSGCSRRTSRDRRERNPDVHRRSARDRARAARRRSERDADKLIAEPLAGQLRTLAALLRRALCTRARRACASSRIPSGRVARCFISSMIDARAREVSGWATCRSDRMRQLHTRGRGREPRRARVADLFTPAR